MKLKTLIIILLAVAVLLAGIFYWLLKRPTQKISYSNPPITNQFKPLNNQKPSNNENNSPATSTPIKISEEISHGNQNKKQIIFTFDMGAGTNSAAKILAAAQKHNLKLTFFSTGKFAEKNPGLIKEISAAGHEIFNHTYDHPYLTKLSDDQIKEELEKADYIISNLTGTTTKPYFRPPYGDRNTNVLKAAAQAGYQSVYWTLDALDWETNATAEAVKTRIETHLNNGAIILMHMGDDITGNILDEVFAYIENQGYKIVNLSEGIK